MSVSEAPIPEPRPHPCARCGKETSEPTSPIIIACRRVWLCARHRDEVRLSPPARPQAKEKRCKR